MRTHLVAATAMLAGFGLGAVTVQGLHAQAKPPAYYVAEINAADPEGWAKTYAPLVEPTLRPFSGRFIARADKTVAWEGGTPGTGRYHRVR
jgi:hypothetical protein